MARFKIHKDLRVRLLRDLYDRLADGVTLVVKLYDADITSNGREGIPSSPDLDSGTNLLLNVDSVNYGVSTNDAFIQGEVVDDQVYGFYTFATFAEAEPYANAIHMAIRLRQDTGATVSYKFVSLSLLDGTILMQGPLPTAKQLEDGVEQEFTVAIKI